MKTTGTEQSDRPHGERAGRSASRGLGTDYWKLLSASVLSNLGDGLALVALPWYASTLTENALAVAAVGVAGRLPWLLFAIIAGSVGDRVDRRRLMATAGAVKAMILIVLCFLVLLGPGSVAAVLVVALAIGTCEVFFDNTSQALLPNLVGRDRLERANGTLWGAEEVSNRFLGAPIAGFLLGTSLVLPFAVQAALTAAAALLLLSIRGDFRPVPEPGSGAGPPPAFRRMLAEGISWMWRHRMLRSLAITLGLFNAAMAMAMAVLVLFAQDVLGLDSQGFGMIMAASAIGAVVSSQVSPWIAVRVPPGATLAGILALQVVLYLALVLVPTVPVFVIGAIALGFNTVWWNIVTVSLRQRIIPDHLLSRVNSVYRTMGWGMSPLGMVAGGAVVTLFESPAGRETALRLPYLFAAVLCGFLLLFTLRNLSTRIIHDALSTAQSAR
ncbi:MFS transporter [Streptomyces sp. NPDC059853]|uniref:MFS transporter n=1 Tax=Streptomyces sp. NPDC059853 TaxID=3346973 RepID=UPI00364F3A1A